MISLRYIVISFLSSSLLLSLPSNTSAICSRISLSASNDDRNHRKNILITPIICTLVVYTIYRYPSHPLSHVIRRLLGLLLLLRRGLGGRRAVLGAHRVVFKQQQRA